ncbi:protein G12-like [Toxorhynchites rutilus septentrionalis]|uniref:protein G12-like n=1 Tax=Toxorhynchites rutilus septentrionalis TaxID=329112 RepID=UPI0024797A34|nr:protein G12-like [Toxorhynchites rutilus septentrionalis]
MNTVILLSTLVALSSGTSAVPVPTCVREDLEDFLELIPTDDLANLALDYYLHDKEVRDAFAYMQDAEFSTAWDQFFALAEVKDLLNYLEDAELDAYDTVNVVADFLGLNHVKPKYHAARRMKYDGLSGFLKDAVDLLPNDKLMALFEKKLETSSEFIALFGKLQRFDFRRLVELHNNSKEIQSLFQKLREHGVDVDNIVETVAAFFGWDYLF